MSKKTHLLVILLKCSKVLPSLRKLALLHPFAHIPMNKCALSIHQIKLGVQPTPRLHNRRCVAEHAKRPLHLGQIPTGHTTGRPVVEANLKEKV